MDGIATIRRVALGLGFVAMITGAGAPSAVGDLAAQTVPAGESPLAGFPGLGRTYHHVSGRQIRASLDGRGPIDSIHDESIKASTEWYLSWWIPEDPDGGCLLDQAEVLLDVTVALPRLVDASALPADLRQRWQEYVAVLEAHEATHVRNAYQARTAMLRAIRQADCASADQVAEDVMEALRQRNAAYDRRTRHGATEGARFP